MSRTLLLCFVHGFKGSDDTFHNFPHDLRIQVAKQLPDHRVEAAVYPRYETSGELAAATDAFLGWIREKVMDIRKERSEKPWPPNDRDVGVILVAHSMGGFVAADTLFLALNDRVASGDEDKTLFPLIQGILAFDTPYNGLARSMFVYGAFSNYQKVSSVFNAMAALSAAAPATLSKLATRRAAGSAVSSVRSSSPAWKTWQIVAVRTGTIGAIAAGGVAAYTHREAIIKGVQSMRNLNKESVAEGYRQSMDAIGQGLAYVNRGSVGKSFAWLSDHFRFVGALLKQKELSRRLDRLAALKGIGVHDYYCSLGENGVWSGGYFVPERTFCAIPGGDHPASRLFSRRVMPETEDEVEAHMNMFRPEKNTGYESMKDEAAELVKKWFLSDEAAMDDERFREAPVQEGSETEVIEDALKQGETEATGTEGEKEGDATAAETELPDESPIDIAAAASMVPLPDDTEDGLGEPPSTEASKTYMQHLFRVAEQAGTGLKGAWPAKMPAMPSMPSMPSIPSMPSMGKMPAVGRMTMPSVNIFSRKDKSSETGPAAEASGEETADNGGSKEETTSQEHVPEEQQQPKDGAIAQDAAAGAGGGEAKQAAAQA